MITLEIWQKAAIYILLLMSLFIYVKTSEIKVNGTPWIKTEYRLLLAIFFPLILIGAILISSIILAIALVSVSLLFLYSFVTKKKIKIQINGLIPKRPPLN